MCTSEENGTVNEIIVLSGGSCTTHAAVLCRNLASFPKSILRESHTFELAHPKKKKKKGHLGTFWFSTFTVSFITTRSLVILWVVVYWWKYTDGHIMQQCVTPCHSVILTVNI